MNGSATLMMQPDRSIGTTPLPEKPAGRKLNATYAACPGSYGCKIVKYLFIFGIKWRVDQRVIRLYSQLVNYLQASFIS
jgi:hypothetical protein